MIYQLRDYQQQAGDAAVRFFNDSDVSKNAIIVLPTGSGKSLVIADIARRLDGNVIVFQPKKEILEQNFMKLKSYGVEDCSIYSASAGVKEVRRITFATIGSAINKLDLFRTFPYVIVDECHEVNSKGGMYKDFITAENRKVLGLTATPYRLCSAKISLDANGRYDPTQESTNKCILKFLTRTRPRIFHDVIYHIDIRTLLDRGYLARLRYFDLSIIDQTGLQRNTTGMDYDDNFLQLEYEKVNFKEYIVSVVNRLLHPKSGIPRKGILVFTRFIEESEYLCNQIENCAMVTGSTPKKERERIISDFKEGKISVVANVGVLTTGFDYPELDTILVARPTMSLALWYQIVGRAIRASPGKDGWIVDLCGNIKRFGRVDDLTLTEPERGMYMVCGIVQGQRKQLTNVYF